MESKISTTATPTQEDGEISLPVDFEIDGGTVSLNNIYIQEEKTDHGYEGWIAFEFDLSSMDDDGIYWFEEDCKIHIYDRSLRDMSKNAIELNEFSELESETQENGKKYIFYLINERRYHLSEAKAYFDIDISGTYHEIEIRCEASKFEILDELPEDIEKIRTDLILNK